MINPIIFTIRIGSFSLAIHWYGVIVMSAILIATWLATRELERKHGDPNWIWDSLPLIVLFGVIGARLWYVVNDILGGDPHYLAQPLDILNIPAGGLHIFGGFLFGGITFLIYARKNKVDVWKVIDSLAPFLLIGQALARPANFINQELYGPPTTLPWGIPISADHRIFPWTDLVQYPVATTRFHPTFAYEMIWNFAAGGLLVWLSHKYEDRLRPGAVFFAWLILAGVGRVIIEAFRPDQPVIPGTGLSYSRLISGLMALAGIILLLGRYDVFHFKFLPPAAESDAPVEEK